MITFPPGVGNGGGLGTPDYDSGWVSMGSGLQWFTHNLGSMELFVYIRYSSNADGSDNRLFQCHGDSSENRIINANANAIAIDHDKGSGKYWRVMIWKL